MLRQGSLLALELVDQHYPAAMSDASQQSDLAHHAAAEPWVSEPAYREGAIDLLGILAYGALAAFDQLAEDARRAPTVADKVYVASLAALQIAHFEPYGRAWPSSTQMSWRR